MRALIALATLFLCSPHGASATIPEFIVSRVETFPIATLPVTSQAHAFPRRDLTIPATSQLQEEKAGVANGSSDAFLLVCSDPNCSAATGSCQILNVSTIPQEVCFQTQPYFSIAVSQPSGEGFPFGIFITPDECETFTQITAVNECFKIGGVFPFDHIVLGEI